MFMEWPIDRVYITQYFGERPSVYKQFGMAGHNGVDFRTRFLTPPDPTPLGRRYIYAALGGEVMQVRNEGNRGYGLFVRLQHGKKAQTIYAHLTRSYVKVGDKVYAGQKIGLSGNSGFSSGPHLHFGYRPEDWEKRYNNGFKGYVDPLPYLKQEQEIEDDGGFDPELVARLIKDDLCMLIVPEKNGETWYLSPKTKKRYRTGRVDAQTAAKYAKDGAWIGITVADLNKIPKA